MLKRIFRKIYKCLRIIIFNIISDNLIIGKRVLKHQPIHANGNGQIVIGDHVEIGVYNSPGFWSSECYLEARGEHSVISIGAETKINNSFTAIATESIEIGAKCLIGDNVFVMDSNFHQINPALRHASGKIPSGSVRVGNNTFIGSRAIILKNTTIGAGSVVAAGAVVSGHFPENSLIKGAPAKLYGNIVSHCECNTLPGVECCDEVPHKTS